MTGEQATAAASGAAFDLPRRGPAFGKRFAVASDHPLVSSTALGVLQRGGNAADATIAAAALNVVLKPDRTHLGGDAFALVWRRRTGEVDCLNAGGRAPLGATLDGFAAGIPTLGPRACTVPGLVDAWLEMHTRYATLPLDSLLKPAIDQAAEGFPVSQHLSRRMGEIAGSKAPEEEALRRAFLADGRRPYAPGERLRQPELAAVLARLVQDGREGFYGGATAAALAGGIAAFGGLIDAADFEKPTAEWHEPIMSTFNGCTVYEQALPSQGIILLEALNISERFPLAEWGMADARATHVLVEATKLAFADVRRYVADPEVEEVPLAALLSKGHAARRAQAIDLDRAGAPGPATLPSDTTSFVVADEEMVVCFIQSVFAPWGSRFVVPGTGILMNNRLSGFSTDPASPNRLAPGKRTRHTLNTFLALRDGKLVIGGGTPGRDAQVQTNLQTIVSLLCWGLDLQAAIDAPRWTLEGDRLALERRFPAPLQAGLAARGHEIEETGAWSATCRSQVLAELAEGGWAAASDLRGEGVALAI